MKTPIKLNPKNQYKKNILLMLLLPINTYINAQHITLKEVDSKVTEPRRLIQETKFPTSPKDFQLRKSHDSTKVPVIPDTTNKGNCIICGSRRFEEGNSMVTVECGHNMHRICSEGLKEAHTKYLCPQCSNSGLARNEDNNSNNRIDLAHEPALNKIGGILVIIFGTILMKQKIKVNLDQKENSKAKPTIESVSP